MSSSRMTPTRGAVAAFAALSMVLVACDGDDIPEIPGFEEGSEQPDENTGADDPAEQDAEATAVPAGAFGPECQRILEAVAHDDAPLAGQDGPDAEGPVGTDDGATGEGVTDEDGLTDEAGPGEEQGASAEDGPGDEAPEGATHEQDTTTQLASMSMEEALDAIPALRPLAQHFNGVETTDLDGGQLTVFAPVDDAIEAQSDGASTGDATGDGPTEGDAGTEEGVGTEDDAGAATDDLEALIRAHVHADGALDAAALVGQGTISTLDDETDLEVRVATESATAGTDATSEDGAAEETGTTEEGATEETGLTEEGASDENGLTEEGATDENGFTEDGATDGNGTDQVEHLTLIVEAGGTEATVLCANIETADGFIHIVDTVLESGDRTGAQDEGDGTETDEDEEPIDETGEEDTGLGDEDRTEDDDEGALDG
jgi:uncharacterized surface protein with fasciclin (FAS1) repeats